MWGNQPPWKPSRQFLFTWKNNRKAVTMKKCTEFYPTMTFDLANVSLVFQCSLPHMYCCYTFRLHTSIYTICMSTYLYIYIITISLSWNPQRSSKVSGHVVQFFGKLVKLETSRLWRNYIEAIFISINQGSWSSVGTYWHDVGHCSKSTLGVCAEKYLSLVCQ